MTGNAAFGRSTQRRANELRLSVRTNLVHLSDTLNLVEVFVWSAEEFVYLLIEFVGVLD